MSHFKKYIFDYAFRGLLLLLPFMTLLSVFTKEKLGIPGFSFIREGLLLLMVFSIFLFHIEWKLKIQWTRYDFLIGVYMVALIIVTLFTTGVSGIIYGGRYDFEFLIAFFALLHGFSILHKPISYYIRLFLIAWGIAIVLGMSLKWPFTEDVLLYFGFSGNPSNWEFGSSIPIFHGVDGANVRRLQWIFDGPNTMGAYLLLYMGVMVYYLRMKKDWYFTIGLVLMILIIGVFYTYSRSAVLWLIWWVGIIILLLFHSFWKKYKAQTIVIFWITLLFLIAIFTVYSGNMRAILERWWSTKGHSERMIQGYHRFLDHPFGQGLWSAGPAYRYVDKLQGERREDIEELDRFYIPESWYIQQFIEGGFIWGILFIWVMWVIFLGLLYIHPVLAGTFSGLLIMNFFLHTFESSFLSLSAFLIFWLIIAHKHALSKQ